MSKLNSRITVLDSKSRSGPVQGPAWQEGALKGPGAKESCFVKDGLSEHKEWAVAMCV